MPNYIEIDKSSSFPSASAGRIVVGVNTNNQLTATNSDGVTSIVGENLPPYTPSYKVYTAKLTQVEDQPSATTTEENTLGFTPDWKYLDIGTYSFNFSQSVDPDKIIPFIYPNSTNNLLSTYEVDSQAYNFFDSTFDSYQGGDGFNQQVRAIAAQSDGKVIVGGNFTFYAGDTHNRIVRLNDDGTADTSFSFGPGTGFNNRVRKIVVQPDGKILVGGDFTTYNGTEVGGIVRLDSVGDIDPDFPSGHGYGFVKSTQSENAGGGNVYDIVVQPDGKILVGGWFGTYDETNTNRLTRLDASGSIDATFINTQDGFYNEGNYDRVSSIALQSDGKIICGGQFNRYRPIHAGTTYSCPGIIKLDSSGSVDTTFYDNIGTGFGNDWVNVVRLQDDDKIVVGMNGNNGPVNYNGTSVDYLTRLNSDGTLDIDFNAIIRNQGYFNAPIMDVKVLTSGHIVAVGYISGGIFRVNSNGYIACEYNGGFNSSCYILETQPYGKILVGGDFSTYGPGITFTTKIARLYGSYDVVLTARDNTATVSDDLLNNTPVEIRQYI
jgi:uncharacterized delta-60 repeat protein